MKDISNILVHIEKIYFYCLELLQIFWQNYNELILLILFFIGFCTVLFVTGKLLLHYIFFYENDKLFYTIKSYDFSKNITFILKIIIVLLYSLILYSLITTILSLLFYFKYKINIFDFLVIAWHKVYIFFANSIDYTYEYIDSYIIIVFITFMVIILCLSLFNTGALFVLTYFKLKYVKSTLRGLLYTGIIIISYEYYSRSEIRKNTYIKILEKTIISSKNFYTKNINEFFENVSDSENKETKVKLKKMRLNK
mgnify:FL=1